MTATNPAAPPNYLHCGRGADPGGEDPVGCRGRRVRRLRSDAGEHESVWYDACLAHLTDADRDAYLNTLSPGSELQHPGTTFDTTLLGRLLAAVRDPATGQPRLGAVDFSGATFQGHAEFREAIFQSYALFGGTAFRGRVLFSRATFQSVALFRGATFQKHAGFDGATFQNETVFDNAIFQSHAMFGHTVFQSGTGFRTATFEGYAEFAGAVFQRNITFDRTTFEDDARFERGTFEDEAGFHGATFRRRAWFLRVTFQGSAWFQGTVFQGDIVFHGATFQDDARFKGVTFQSNARFSHVTFQGDVRFNGATVQGDTWFNGTAFERAPRIGPFVCWGTVDLSAAVFDAAVIIEVAAGGLDFQRTRWASTAGLRLRHATVDLSDAVMEYPVSVTAHAAPFPRERDDAAADESGIEPAAVRMLSLRGVDAAHLSLTDVDLSGCRFAGTVHLDQLRLYGRCPLPRAPGGWHRRGLLPVRFTARQTLAEEQYWRAARADAAAGWMPPPDGSAPLEPAALVPLYRELRKTLEDAKDEPGAADFYYGEMEMRRHDPRTPAAERFLLRLYWALSGYGLRASRALGWLLVAMFTTVVLMMLWGLPKESPKPVSTGTVDGRSGRGRASPR
ncbi:pentapeptide repeat-containing protein [Streptomyces sp. CNQ-509]|uniref:pentapeptide repeat-containing protein n=1 Tax=Streptomyces sp. CNQ-509 TaxID=444103 RepID=UPI00099BA4DE|nr:pentapeptide repeat-containing protein [Streptomyces sp. CNQ-509]